MRNHAVVDRFNRDSRHLQMHRLVHTGSHGHQVRQVVADEFVTFLYRSQVEYESWQDGWNRFAEAGTVSVRPPRCLPCNGRGWHARWAAQTGGVCPTCHGSRRGTIIHVRVLPVHSPAAT